MRLTSTLPLLLPTLSLSQWNTDNAQVYDPPTDQSPSTYKLWEAARLKWVTDTQTEIDFSIFDDYPQLNWTQTSFIQPQLMIHEKTLYDKATNTFNVSNYVADINERYDGIESVLLWPTYPNIGADDRNQFDMHYSFDIEQLQVLVSDFHDAGIKVLWPYNPWDQGTRNAGKSDMESLADLIIDTGADGFNGDTMDGVNASFFEEAASRGHPIVIEPEYTHANYVDLGTNLWSWNYWQAQYTDIDAPAVSAWKMLSGSRTMNHICERWATDRTDGLQNAFFNGMGYITWENVWGIFNKITDRDGAVMKRTSKILRTFGEFVQTDAAEFLPHYPMVKTEDSKVYGSLFADRGGEWNVFLLVNRNRSEEDYEGGTVVDMNLVCPEGSGTVFLYDLWRGEAPASDVTCDSDGGIDVDGYMVEGGGYGAFLISTTERADLKDFLKTMSDITATPLSTFDNTFSVTPQTILDNTDVDLPAYMGDGGESGKWTVKCKGSQHYNFTVAGNAIEGDDMANSSGVDVQFPFEDLPNRYHSTMTVVPDLIVDKYPVTYREFKNFLDDSGYRPAVNDINFLRDWDNESMTYLDGFDNKPVTWISHNDARVYCAYYGKRLPGSIEWQYIAQGQERYRFPWGEEEGVEGKHFPKFSMGREMPMADDVDAHVDGESWCGVGDLVGNVYQWTDVFMDEHTDRAVVRGGNRWRSDVSFWYFVEPEDLFVQSTYLLSSEGLDRSGGIGFRCVEVA